MFEQAAIDYETPEKLPKPQYCDTISSSKLKKQKEHRRRSTFKDLSDVKKVIDFSQYNIYDNSNLKEGKGKRRISKRDSNFSLSMLRLR